jgi:hypothetical protein
MADIVLTIDPDDTSFALHDRANGRRLMGFDAPVPETDSQWAFSADTEGERRANLRYRNRVITAQVLLDKSTAALLEALENTLGQKVGKLAREGGELRFTYPTGTTITFNVLEASMNRVFDIADMAKFRARYEISFICEPFGLGTEVDMGDNTETTLPVLIFTETGILGDVDGQGRLLVDNDASTDQWWAVWGVEQDVEYTFTDSTGSGALFYQAESRTVLGGATAVAGPSGASGAGSNVVRQASLSSTYQAMLSTQATGGGAHLTHVGTFNVFARIQMPTTNTGAVSVAFEWAQGDFRRRTTNAAVTFDADHQREGTWIFQKLGQVTIRKIQQGAHRWEGRIVAKSTIAGDDLDVDYLLFVPTKTYGEASGIQIFETASSFLARDEFDQSAGALTGKTLPVGGTWGGAGDADDFSVLNGIVRRTAVSDTASALNTGRFVRAGSAVNAAIAVQVDVTASAQSSFSQLALVRYVDTSNFVAAGVTTIDLADPATPTDPSLIAFKYVAGSFTLLRQIPLTDWAINTWFTQRVIVDTTGRLFLWWGRQAGAMGSPKIALLDTSLATGGTLDDGGFGLFDEQPNATACTRTYDNFVAFTPAVDAAIFGSQSLQITHEVVEREDSTGTFWNEVSDHPGDYLRVSPAGAEGRSSRVVVKGCSNDPNTMPDSSIDDISARLFVTPRFLVVPDA